MSFSLLNLVFSAYPELSISQTSYPSGEITILGQVSSGVDLRLYVNDNLVDSKVVTMPLQEVYLNDDIVDVNLAVGQQVKFINNNSGVSDIKLDFSTGKFANLNFAESTIFVAFSEGVYTYKNQNTQLERSIYVTNKVVDFNFSNINQDYFQDGKNQLRFDLYSLESSTILLESFTFEITYNKYSNNIEAVVSKNITSSEFINVSGSVSDSSSPLFYALNYAGNGLISGYLTPITVTGGKFNFKVKLSQEGENEILILSYDQNNPSIINGEKKVTATLDTVDPYLDVVDTYYGVQANNNKKVVKDGDKIYANSNGLTLKLASDAKILEYSFNGKNESVEFDNGTVELRLNRLVRGQNNLTLTAIDEAGNYIKRAHAIYFDDRIPDIIRNSLDPKDSSTVHFFLQDLKGKTNKPNVKITAFTLPESRTYYYTDENGLRQSKEATCSDFEFLGIKSLGQLDRNRQDGIEANPEEVQVSLLGFLAGNEVTTTSDSDGDFKLENIVLQQKDFTRYDLNPNGQNPPDTKKQTARNTVCLILSDEFGNARTKEIKLTLDSGNTFWKAGAISTLPNTLMAAEIEQVGDFRLGDTRVSPGVTVKLTYIGSGDVETVERVTIFKDSSNKEGSYRNFDVVSSQMNYAYDKSKRELLIYFPIRVNPLKVPFDEYPSKLKLDLAAKITYTLTDKQIQIDTTNPVYFKTEFNIESPYETAKWLSPSNINDWISFINKSIKATKKLVDVSAAATKLGVISCVGAKFWYALSDKTPEDRKMLYSVCDRVACPAAPPRCDTSQVNGKSVSELGLVDSDDPISVSDLKKKRLSGIDLDDNYAFKKGETLLGQVDSIKYGGLCNYIGSDGKPKKGVYVDATVVKYKAEENSFTGSYTQTGSSRLNQKCVEATFENEDNCNPNSKDFDEGKCKIESINLNSVTNFCYSEDAPNYDWPKCFGQDNVDPTTNFFSALRCGCFPTTYSHLKGYLKLQEAIKGCLEEVKIGQAKGSYCERLMSIGVCDILVSEILTDSTVTKDPKRNENELGFIEEMRRTDKELNDRYGKNAFFSSVGLNSNQIVQKTCVAAISGDWSVLGDSILGALDEIEIDPTFGTPIPESRLEGVNPISGKLSIRYSFTHALVSGGSQVTSEYVLVCDSSKAGGENCPSGVYVSPNLKKTITTSKGGSAQDLVVIRDTDAKFWYNQLKVKRTWMVNGEIRSEEKLFPINHKSESLPFNCHFSAGVTGVGVGVGVGSGISCDSLFDENSVISAYQILPTTKIVPEEQRTFYPGNTIYLKLDYDILEKDIQNQQEGFVLAYMSVCKNRDGDDIILGIDGKADKRAPGFVNLENVGYSQTKVIPTQIIPPFTSDKNKFEFRTTEEVSFVKNNDIKYYVEVINKNTQKAAIISILKLTDISSESNVKINVGNFPISAQNLNFEGSKDIVANYYELKEIPTELEDKKLKMLLDYGSDINDLAISIVKIEINNNGKKLSQRIPFVKYSDEIAEGKCTLKMRILPSNLKQDLTRENFEDFSVYNQDSQDPNSGVIFDRSVDLERKQIFNIDFNIKEKPAEDNDVQEYLDLVYPQDKAVLCIDKNNNANLYYLYQNSKNTKNPTEIKLEYKLDGGRFGVLAKSIAEDKICQGISKISIDLEISDSLKEILSSTSDENSISDYLFGNPSLVEANLIFKAIKTKDKDLKTISSENIKVNLIYSDSCSLFEPKETQQTCNPTISVSGTASNSPNK